jgi:hypothetical protein
MRMIRTLRQSRCPVIQVECDCGRVIKTSDENAGKKARCPECGDVVQLPRSPKRATSNSTSSTGKPAAKSSSKRPPEDDEFDDGALDEDDWEDDEVPELPRPKSKAKSKLKSKNESAKQGGKANGSASTKKKKRSAEDDTELNRKILIGTGVAVGVVVVGLLVFLIMNLPGGGGGAKVAVPQNFVAFSSKNGEINCEAPQDWASKTGGGQGGVPPYATFEKGSIKISFRSSPSGGSFQMMAQAGGNDDGELPDELKPVSKVHEIQKRKFEDEMSGYQEQGNPVMINTKGFGEGRMSEFTANVGFGKVYGYRVTLLGTNNQWNCVCQCSASQWKDFQPVFRRIIESSAGS